MISIKIDILDDWKPSKGGASPVIIIAIMSIKANDCNNLDKIKKIGPVKPLPSQTWETPLEFLKQTDIDRLYQRELDGSVCEDYIFISIHGGIMYFYEKFKKFPGLLENNKLDGYRHPCARAISGADTISTDIIYFANDKKTNIGVRFRRDDGDLKTRKYQSLYLSNADNLCYMVKMWDYFSGEWKMPLRVSVVKIDAE